MKGGKRKNSGRKPLSKNEKTVAISILVTESQRKKALEISESEGVKGAAFGIRKALEEYKS